MHRSLGEKIVDVKFLKRGVDRELSFEMVQNMFLSFEICKTGEIILISEPELGK